MNAVFVMMRKHYAALPEGELHAGFSSIDSREYNSLASAAVYSGRLCRHGRRVGVQAEWPCWGKMRTIHCDNAREFRGTVIGRACQDHDIAIEHRPPREPRYGGHIERGFGTWLTRARRLKGTTFSN